MRKPSSILTLTLFAALIAATTARADYSNTLMALTPQPVAYWPLQETTVPQAYVATNLGTLGAAANGYYMTWWNGVNTTNLYLTNTIVHQAGATADGDTAFGELAQWNAGQFVGWPRNNPDITVRVPFTVEAWVRPTNTTLFSTILSQGRVGTSHGIGPAYNGSGRGFWLGQVGNTFLITLFNNNGTAGYEIPVVNTTYINQWTHLAATFDGTNLTFYVNGQVAPVNPAGTTQVRSNPSGPTTAGVHVNAGGNYFEPDTTSPLLIGWTDNGSSGPLWGGGIDEVAIYTNVLSGARVLAHFAAASGGSYASTVLADNPPLYVRLNEPDMATVLGQPNGTLIANYPGLPTAVNYGTLGVPANGKYIQGSVPGGATIPYAGFGTLTNAALFNGINGAVNVGNGGLLPSALNPTNLAKFSIAAWFKPNPSDARNRFQHIIGHEPNNYRLSYDGSAANRFNPGGGQELQFANALDAATNGAFFNFDGQWHFVVGVADGASDFLYLDGRLVKTNTQNAITSNLRDLFLGGDPNFLSVATNNAGRYFAGSLAHVAYLTNALSASDVQNLYDAGAALAPYMILQPEAYTTFTGYTAKFVAGVGGGGPLTFQWYKGTPGSGTLLTDGGNIAGATKSALVLTGVSGADADSYFLIGNNNAGSVTSSVVTLTVSTMPAASTYASTVLALNPVGYWPLNETNQGVRTYIATNLGTLGASLNGMYSVWWPNNQNVPYVLHNILRTNGVTGDGNLAMRFGDNGQYVTLPHSSASSVITAPFSVEAWVNPYATPGLNGIVSQGRNNVLGVNAWKGFFLGANGTSAQFSLYNTNGQVGQDIILPTVLTVGSWTHLVGTFDGTTATLYVNGTLISIGNPLTLNTNSAGLTFVPDDHSSFIIGCLGTFNAGRMPAYIDEVAVYTNALTQAQALAHYNAAASGYKVAVLAQNPSVYLRLDEPAYVVPVLTNLPVATNYGSLGAVAAGFYQPGTSPGIAGPPGTGFGSSSYAVGINGIGGAVDIGRGRNIAFNVPALTPIGTVSPANNLSIIAWFKGPVDAQSRFQNIVGHSDASWRMAFDGRPRFNPGGGGDLVGPSYIFNDVNWHMMVATLDGVSNRIYVDGALITSAANNNAGAGDGRDVVLGGDPQYTNPQNRLFGGAIAQVAFFTNALSAATVSNVYFTAGIPPFISQQPRSAAVNAGSAFTNAMIAGGSPTLTYQWYSIIGGTTNLLATQTNANLVLNPVQGTNAGGYFVTINNGSGAATSTVVTLTVFTAPQVVQQPTPTTRYLGATARFTVVATGALPLSYQWRSNTVAILNATNTTLLIPNVQFASQANYSCRVTNFLGADISTDAALTVITQPTEPYPLSVIGDNPMGYWRLGEATGVTAYDYWGGYDGFETNVSQGVTGYPANPPDPDTGIQVGSVHTNDSYVGSIPITFGSPTNSGTNFSVELWCAGLLPTTDAGLITKGTGGGGEQFNLDCGGPGHGFRFFVRDSNGGGHRATTAIAPDGNWHHVVGVCSQTTSNVLLYVDGVLVGSATGGEQILTNQGIFSTAVNVSFGSRRAGVGPVHDNQFIGSVDEVAIYSYALSSTQVVNHYYAAGIAPSISLQPTNVTAAEGTTAVFNAAARGTPTLYYQWYDVTTTPTAVPGQNGPNLTLTNVTAAMNNNVYQLTVTNAFGTIDSGQVILTVVSGPPMIISDVQNPFYVYAGASTSNSASFGGTAPFTYRWQKGGVNLADDGRITGSQTNTLVINAAKLSDAGNYQLTVTNVSGSNASSVATLIVGSGPVTFNTNGLGWKLNGGSTVFDNLLTLTDGGSQARSAYFSYQQYIGAFRATFTYQAGGNIAADGVAFVVQNSPAGTSALGTGGGGLGYGGITPSAAVQLNIYGAAAGGVGYAFNINGVTGPYLSTAPLALNSGNPIDVTVLYALGTLSLTLTDAVAVTSFTTNLAIGDLPTTVGGDTAFVGFSGATGGFNAIQTITNFTFIPIPTEAIRRTGTNTAVVSWHGAISGYGLQGNTNLATPNWDAVTNADEIVNQQHEVIVKPPGKQQFYRLKLP